MALLNRLDPETTGAALRDWLRKKLTHADGVDLRDISIPQGAGMSMTTVMVTAEWREDGAARLVDLVVRVAPEGAGVFKTTDLGREFRVMEALAAHTDVRVPSVLWLEEDSSVLGSPFLVMERISGNVPADDPPYSLEGWVLELDQAQRARLIPNALRELAKIHAVDWRELGLDSLAWPEFGALGMEQQLNHWRDAYAWAHAGRPSPTIDGAFEWMEANRPAEDEIVLSWGDARIGNILYDKADLSARGVLDWELATLGPRELDLGWFLFMARYSTAGVGAPVPDGMQSREEILACYEELTGHRPQHTSYYEAFGALRGAISAMRMGQLLIEAGALPEDNPMPYNNPPAQILAELTGQPAPEGLASDFVGNR